MLCVTCSNPLSGRQTKYCSSSCKQKTFANDTKVATGLYPCDISSFSRKLKLLKLFGGKCSSCGYNDNLSCLHFHHVLDKKFGLSSRNLAKNSWTNILREAEKCELLCACCHMKHHHPDYNIGIAGALVKDSMERKTKLSQKERSIGKKLRLIALHNSKCKVCGYNDNIAALNFHHITYLLCIILSCYFITCNRLHL